MTWVRIDDAALSHPKIARAGVDGFGLWMGSLAYANRHVTDGFIPSDCLALLVPSSWKLGETRLALIAERLVTLALWHPVEGGWLIHGYSEYQEQALKVNVSERRERDAERKRQSRNNEKRRRNEGGHSVTPADGHSGVTRHASAPVTRPVTNTSADASADSRPPLSQPPVPSRPVPSRPDPVTKVTEGETRAGAREPAPLKTVGQDLIERTQATRALLEEGFKSRGLKVPPCLHDRVPYSKEAQAIAESVPLTELPALIENFFANAWAAKRHFDVTLIVKNPNEYTGTVNPRQVRANSEYRDRTAEETAALWTQGRTA
jgi:hypothetical protein